MIGEMAMSMAWGLVLMVVLMSALWLAHLRIRNAAVVDVGWGAGLGALACLYAAAGSAPPFRRLLLAVLVGTWAFRLSWHLYRDRVAAGTPEEGRYQTLRASWGDKAARNFYWFFLAQGALNALLSLPFLLAANNPAPDLSPWEWTAACLWLLALAGESLADSQLKAFKADPANKGKVCRKGLWNFSRHPNYFCEWLIWCAYALLATAAPHGYAGWIGPAVILFLLLRVTGIPATEQQALRSRGAEYKRYQAATNAFFPWFPRKTKG